MKTSIFLLAIVIAFCCFASIDANERKTFAEYLSEDQLFSSLVEIKWREYLVHKYRQAKDESLHRLKINRLSHDSNEENRARTFVRRKLVGISDNPF